MANESTELADPRVAVVVPAYNEVGYIDDTIRALQQQTFRDTAAHDAGAPFRIIVVDNNSTDGTGDLVRELASHSDVPIDVLTETEKGTGSAADSGFRHAIDGGAQFIARTDADTLPAPDWLTQIVAPLLDGKSLVGGRVRARSSDGARAIAFNLIGTTWRLGHFITWLRTRSQPAHLRKSFLVVGNNLAVSADTYCAAGGFPRTKIDDVDEDAVLQQRVTEYAGADSVALAPHAVVYTSLRRLQAYGTRGYLDWYHSKNAGDGDAPTDVR
ncbi:MULTISPECIES: glycosyltransferase [Gordonia]|uniref:4,4'-diaponeurosporenoate glycosyltransferase n=1 Tax=Gordonia sputi NBRC 100414 TaxID=1089453 RepID=H5U3X9_9ACTN|nr:MULTISPECIES: glycosyltransferase family A protein [Gordonia]NKY92346.1 glycosyltransferase [Gordonia sputi]OBA41918.1 hypothetical protein A5766_20275 [Gordonia sp. 852002-51296_SCH5728562-b]GAB40437.1 putative glycosyltransferase [Gordonia sputi NBRC 100414]